MMRGYRLYPSKDQGVLISKHLGCCRFVYNWGLNLKNEAYQNDGVSLSAYDLHKRLPALKVEHPRLKEVNAQPLQQSITHLARAFTNFFEGRAEKPVFKKKHSPEQSFTVPQSYTVDFERGTMKLPKIGAVKTVFHRRFAGKTKSATVTRTSAGRYFISILVDGGQKPPEPAVPIPEQTVGIDLGLTHYLFSTGSRKPSVSGGNPERGRHGEESRSGGSHQRRRVGNVRFDAGIQVSGSRENPAPDRDVRALLEDLFGLRLPEDRPDAQGPGMDLPDLRDAPRPGPERRNQHQTVCTLRYGTCRRACGLAPAGEGDDSREAPSGRVG